ncbi:mitotic spindle checkpoint protein Bub3 [Taxawa tesnikishii (nom. ined.)]|nr:mitotic spindle checkpoint protein Bub3 [Dothideales sp. JES 119]
MSGHQFELSDPPTDAISAVKFAPDSPTRLLVSSWDRNVYLYDIQDGQTGRQQSSVSHAPATIPLPSKPFSVSATATRLVVAMASRAIFIYDLNALYLMASEAVPSDESHGENVLELEPWQQRESSLKFMTRAVACMPTDEGYALSSIEGRVGVDWFDPNPETQAKKYAFKCHRQTEEGVDVVYPVNALAFHPVNKMTFASGGGDGFVVLWDGSMKRRIRQYQNFPASVSSLAWSADGKYLAVGVSPGFEDGKEVIEEGSVKVFVREVTEAETKGKGAK